MAPVTALRHCIPLHSMHKISGAYDVSAAPKPIRRCGV